MHAPLRTLSCVGYMLLAILSMSSTRAARAAAPATLPAPRMSYLDNGVIRLGVDLSIGGAITWLSPAGSDRNVINSYDWGRQVQMSYYSGPVPFFVGDNRPANHWEGLGWNPIQSGDDHRHGSKVLEWRNDGKTIYVKCIPMQWPLDDVPGECTFESWLTLDGSAVKARCQLNNARADHRQYPARTQELPAVYTNGPYYRLMTYSGDAPFTQGALSRIEKRPGEKGPWSRWFASENWAALVNDDGWGVGVWNPGCYRFSGGFAGKPGKGGAKDGPTGYIAPNRQEILDHNIVHAYGYTLVLGTLDDIRRYVYAHADRPHPPRYRFETDRQGWSYVNAADTGWPIQGMLNVEVDGSDPQMIGPAGFWRAEDAPVLQIEAAFHTARSEAQIYWKTFDDTAFSGEKCVTFHARPDGAFHTYDVRLADAPAYRGAITQLRFDPVPAGEKGERVEVRSIGFATTRPSHPE